MPPSRATAPRKPAASWRSTSANHRLSLDKPLLKDHLSGDYVTTGLDVHGSIFMGGPGVVYGIGEDPHPVFPPKYDDLMIVNRIGWRGFINFQMFRPEYFEVVESCWVSRLIEVS